MAGAGTAWALTEGQADFRRSTRNVSPEKNSRKGDLLWVWIPCKLRNFKKKKKKNVQSYVLWTSLYQAQNKTCDFQGQDQVGGSQGKHAWTSDQFYHTRWRSPTPHSQPITVQWQLSWVWFPPGAKSMRRMAWFIEDVLLGQTGKGAGKPTRGRERNHARLLP